MKKILKNGFMKHEWIGKRLWKSWNQFVCEIKSCDFVVGTVFVDGHVMAWERKSLENQDNEVQLRYVVLVRLLS